ncbi:hypothetical protein P7K49_021153 [Saguinus oedipus]|uniref:Uncharacterized protein n=1 Tax=Saguinus oedipus TaxID=9490 RepID=A0ABQ9USL6_SAGOE|nr:hypothetical protein P7K49_021153 [Saguinus oedipus]
MLGGCLEPRVMRSAFHTERKKRQAGASPRSGALCLVSLSPPGSGGVDQDTTNPGLQTKCSCAVGGRASASPTAHSFPCVLASTVLGRLQPAAISRPHKRLESHSAPLTLKPLQGWHSRSQGRGLQRDRATTLRVFEELAKARGTCKPEKMVSFLLCSTEQGRRPRRPALSRELRPALGV